MGQVFLPFIALPPRGERGAFTPNQLAVELLFEQSSSPFTNTGAHSFATIPFSGGVSSSTTQAFQGSRSCRFSGAFDNTNALQSGSGLSDLVIGTADFEISVYFYFQAVLGFWGQGLFTLTNSSSSSSIVPIFYLAQTTGVLIYQSSMTSPSVSINTGIVPTLNAWKEIKVRRASGVTSVYYDGTSVGSAADTSSYGAATFIIGSFYNFAGGGVDYYIDQFRFWNGNLAP